MIAYFQHGGHEPEV